MMLRKRTQVWTICSLAVGLCSGRVALAADRDKDKIDDASDWCPTTPETYNKIDDDDGCPDEKGDLIKLEGDQITILEKVGFLSGKAQILGRSASLLDHVAKLLKDNTQITLVEIQGHTDNQGAAEENLKMSQLRAQAVLNALVTRGIERTRLEAKGYGDTKPIEGNDTEAGRGANRRVNFVVTKSAARTDVKTNNDEAALMMSSRGTVNVDMPNGVAARGTKGLLVLNASELATGVESECEINMPTGTRTRVAQNSKVKVWTKTNDNRTTATKVRVVFGSIWAKVVGAVGGKPEDYSIETPNAVAGVRGTEFSINVREVDGKPVTELSTTEGAVALTVGGKTVEVPAGQGVVAKGDPKTEPVVMSEPRALPVTPTQLDPYWGEFGRVVSLKWKPIPGVTYRVEVARDAYFQDTVVNAPVGESAKGNMVATQEQASYRFEAPADGTYFWRVRSELDGLHSIESQIFSFSVVSED